MLFNGGLQDRALDGGRVWPPYPGMNMILAIPFPNIDPVAFSIGPVDVRWYSLAYIAGLLFAIWYAKRLVSNRSLWGKAGPSATADQIDGLLIWVTLGVILGGRLGYVIFYNPAFFAANPVEILKLWTGGMSFHGGFLGVVIACWLYGRKHGIGLDQLLDLGAATVPVGLGLGRLANFVRGELYGRASDVPWAMVFPGAGPEPRHPSQLYEFALEGAVLFMAVRIATHRFKVLARPGLASAVFATGYGLSRIAVEFAREPDAHIGYIAGWATLGMIYSLPLVATGLWLAARARKTVVRDND